MSTKTRTGAVQGTVAHPLVRDTAVQLAEALYEGLAFNNEWYQRNRDREAWVRHMYPKLLEEARTALANTLGEGSMLPEDQKQQVLEALIRDNSLRPNRKRIRCAVA